MSTEQKVTIAASALVEGDIIVIGAESAIIVDARPSGAWPTLIHITYQRDNNPTIYGGYWHRAERFEVTP